MKCRPMDDDRALVEDVFDQENDLKIEWRYSLEEMIGHIPINPIVRPRTKRPFSEPFSINSVASSNVKQPQLRNKSTMATPIQPSTFKIKLGF